MRSGVDRDMRLLRCPGIVSPMIRFSRAGATPGSTSVALDTDRALETARRAFFADHCVKVSGFLANDLFSEIAAMMEDAEFHEHAEGLGSEAYLKQDSPITSLLWLLINDERLFAAVEALTDCSPIGVFQGRVYRFTDSPKHHDDWHDDLGDNRLVAMSVNLSSHPYEGGLLQIRDRSSALILHEEANTGPGDALIFHLAPELQHRVTRVTGNRPKTAFAGWFKVEPHFKELLASRGAA
jgi:2OG-Fe(II) oxygenase superfamily